MNRNFDVSIGSDLDLSKTCATRFPAKPLVSLGLVGGSIVLLSVGGCAFPTSFSASTRPQPTSQPAPNPGQSRDAMGRDIVLVPATPTGKKSLARDKAASTASSGDRSASLSPSPEAKPTGTGSDSSATPEDRENSISVNSTPGSTGSETIETSLTGANLAGAELIGANLLNAEFALGDLRGVNLQGARLNGANLQGANLAGANLKGVWEWVDRWAWVALVDRDQDRWLDRDRGCGRNSQKLLAGSGLC